MLLQVRCRDNVVDGSQWMGSNRLCVWYVSVPGAGSLSTDVLLLQCVAIYLKVGP